MGRVNAGNTSLHKSVVPAAADRKVAADGHAVPMSLSNRNRVCTVGITFRVHPEVCNQWTAELLCKMFTAAIKHAFTHGKISVNHALQDYKVADKQMLHTQEQMPEYAREVHNVSYMMKHTKGTFDSLSKKQFMDQANDAFKTVKGLFGRLVLCKLDVQFVK